MVTLFWRESSLELHLYGQIPVSLVSLCVTKGCVSGSRQHSHRCACAWSSPGAAVRDWPPGFQLTSADFSNFHLPSMLAEIPIASLYFPQWNKKQVLDQSENRRLVDWGGEQTHWDSVFIFLCFFFFKERLSGRLSLCSRCIQFSQKCILVGETIPNK